MHRTGRVRTQHEHIYVFVRRRMPPYSARSARAVAACADVRAPRRIYVLLWYIYVLLSMGPCPCSRASTCHTAAVLLMMH